MKNIEIMDINDLESLWLKTFHRQPPIRTEWFLRGNLLYQQRCQGQESLSSVALDQLKAIAMGKAERPMMKTGTKLFREWQGEAHEVEVVADGIYLYPTLLKAR